MQNEILINLPQPLLEAPALGSNSNYFSFVGCQRLTKLTTHDIYRFKHEGISLIVKVFPLNCLENYQLEVSQLTRIHHPNVIKIIQNRQALDRSSNNQFDRSHIIVSKEANRGDLNDYLPKYGRMDQKLARTYFKKMIETFIVLYKAKPAILHPNLLATSLLLDSEGQLQICGWSELNTKSETIKLQECLFACGQILVCMVTSFLPFYKKYSPTDTFYKLINSADIHKFWNQLTKTMRKIDKQFQFSSSFKQLINDIFLKKVSNFDQILQYSWIKDADVYFESQLKQVLEKNQKIKNEKIQIKKNQQLAIQQKRKKIIHDSHLNFGLNRSTDSNIQFIRDYQQNIIGIDQVPLTKDQFYCKIQGNSPCLIIASLKQFFNSSTAKETRLFSEQFQLHTFEITKKNNQVYIELNFELIVLEQEEKPLQCEIVSIKLNLIFMRNSNKEFLADIYVIESGFNYFYSNLVVRSIKQKILLEENCKQLSKYQK